MYANGIMVKVWNETYVFLKFVCCATGVTLSFSCHDYRSETYEYFSLPFCAPEGGVKYKTLGMGEVVDANRMASTPYMLNFNTDRTNAVICETPLSQDNLVKFRKVTAMARGGYWVQSGFCAAGQMPYVVCKDT